MKSKKTMAWVMAHPDSPEHREWSVTAKALSKNKDLQRFARAVKSATEVDKRALKDVPLGDVLATLRMVARPSARNATVSHAKRCENAQQKRVRDQQTFDRLIGVLMRLLGTKDIPRNYVDFVEVYWPAGSLTRRERQKLRAQCEPIHPIVAIDFGNAYFVEDLIRKSAIEKLRPQILAILK